MGYQDLAAADNAAVIMSLGEASGVPVNQGTKKTFVDTVHSTPARRVGVAPVGPSTSLTGGWMTGAGAGAGASLGRVDHTIMCWVRTTNTGSSRTPYDVAQNTIVSDWTGSIFRAFGIHAGKVEYSRYVASPAQQWNRLSTTASVADGQWHWILVTCIGSTGLVYLWVDGVADSNANLGIEHTANLSSWSIVGGSYLSNARTSRSQVFDGEVAGLVILPIALSNARCLEYYQAYRRELVVGGG